MVLDKALRLVRVFLTADSCEEAKTCKLIFPVSTLSMILIYPPTPNPLVDKVQAPLWSNPGSVTALLRWTDRRGMT